MRRLRSVTIALTALAMLCCTAGCVGIYAEGPFAVMSANTVLAATKTLEVTRPDGSSKTWTTTYDFCQEYGNRRRSTENWEHRVTKDDEGDMSEAYVCETESQVQKWVRDNDTETWTHVAYANDALLVDEAWSIYVEAKNAGLGAEDMQGKLGSLAALIVTRTFAPKDCTPEMADDCDVTVKTDKYGDVSNISISYKPSQEDEVGYHYELHMNPIDYDNLKKAIAPESIRKTAEHVISENDIDGKGD